MAALVPGKMPKDAAVMAAILKEAGVSSYDPRVIDQMLEFAYKYVTNVLDDGRVYCNHAKKKNIDLDDIKLAVQMQLEQNYTTPPSRDMLAEIARPRNSQPLPLIKPQCGLRLPPDRYCLTAVNYKLKMNKPARTSRLSTLGERVGGTGTKVAVVPHTKPSSNMAASAAAHAGSAANSSTLHMTMPKFKLQSDTSSGGSPTVPRIQFSVPTNSSDSSNTSVAVKRKRADD